MLMFGLDCGIASVGWAVARTENEVGEILGAGTRMFDAPEESTQKGPKLKSAERRQFRGQRRVIRRRRQRMTQIRALLHQHGLLTSADRDALKHPHVNPWDMRVAGLERLLTATEFAVALGHIARHRAFQSNAKAQRSNDTETGKMVTALKGVQDKLAQYQTPAALLMGDEAFVAHETKRRDGSIETIRRLRNREGDYSRSLARADLAAEVRTLFRTQRSLGASFAAPDLEAEFAEIAFTQRPLQDSEARIGPCPFEPDERRTAKLAPSFERFRYLARLINLSVVQGRSSRRLTPEEFAAAQSLFGTQATISFATLRRKLALPEGWRFDGIKPEEEGKRDIAARQGQAAKGTALLRHLVIEAAGQQSWFSLLNQPALLDRIAEILSFRNDPARIRQGLAEAGLGAELVAVLGDAAEEGDLNGFTGAAHLSAKAIRAILPGLERGLTYDAACNAAGYDHTMSSEQRAFAMPPGVHGKAALKILLHEERLSPLVGSPTARKALIEAVKQVKALVEIYGVPDAIHVEMARDVGKSIEERKEISDGIEKRNKYREKLRAEFAENIGRPPAEGHTGREEMLRYELWREQQGRCLYSDIAISPQQLVASDNSVQVDHILPWSRFGDDSFINKTLCLTRENQNKKARTPFEWFQADRPTDWERFRQQVEAIKFMKGRKKRNYLLQNAEAVQEKFRNRNLNDTRWTCRLLAQALKVLYPADERHPDGSQIRRIFTRAGALTDRLRQGWGLQWLKKGADGKRLPDDRHHALDAIIIAATSESQMQRLTKAFQDSEQRGDVRDFRALEEPWPGFRQQALATVAAVFVSRAERRRARGKVHDANPRRVEQIDGRDQVLDRKAVDKLTAKDLTRIKDPERNQALIAALSAWLAADKPKDQRPLSPKGDPIRKVTLLSDSKPAVRLNSGNPDQLATADRDKMPRVDVFAKANAKGVVQYFLVPIYPHQIVMLEEPPNRAVVAHKSEMQWVEMGDGYQFLWSISIMDLIEVVSVKGEKYFDDQINGNIGYFKGLDISDGSIAISSVNDSSRLKKSIGARTLVRFRKLRVDRLGNVSEAGQEVRTWRGKACI